MGQGNEKMPLTSASGISQDKFGKPVALAIADDDKSPTMQFQCPYCGEEHARGNLRAGVVDTQNAMCPSPLAPWKDSCSVMRVTTSDYNQWWVPFVQAEQQRLLPTRQRVFDACDHFFAFLKAHVGLREKILILWVRPPYHVDPAKLDAEWDAYNCGVPEEWNALWYSAGLFKKATQCRNWLAEWRRQKKQHMPSRGATP